MVSELRLVAYLVAAEAALALHAVAPRWLARPTARLWVAAGTAYFDAVGRRGRR